MKSLHERVTELETEVLQLRLALELFMGKPAVAKVLPRPTLEQALAMAEQVGVTAEDAEIWWNARSAVDWCRGTAGGGLIPIGSNHAADLKTFTLSMKGRNGHANGSGSLSHARPKSDTVWSLKTSLEAVNEQIRDIDSTLVGAWAELGPKKKAERAELVERRKELRRKLSGLGE